ncbi:MAG: 3-mercaptopyruvate sulfurtransferase [Pseudomonadota bacterium]
MRWTTLISVEELAETIDRCVVIDVRHDLMAPGAGRVAYDEAHIPGAFFLGQETDLSGAKNGRNGRHPLPDRDALAARLSAMGLGPGRQLVAYDAQNGMFASRLWWLARWLGHDEVAVLDGGIEAWKKAGFPVSQEVPAPRDGGISASAPRMPAVDATTLMAGIGTRRQLIVDARAPERYRGETEPLDPVAGHIPGAVNRPVQLNVRPDGRFKPGPVLRQEFEALLGSRAPSELVHSCGSGISACHNLLAMEFAGLSGSALYPGSWSEWCADPARPVATGG